MPTAIKSQHYTEPGSTEATTRNNLYHAHLFLKPTRDLKLQTDAQKYCCRTHIFSDEYLYTKFKRDVLKRLSLLKKQPDLLFIIIIIKTAQLQDE